MAVELRHCQRGLRVDLTPAQENQAHEFGVLPLEIPLLRRGQRRAKLRHIQHAHLLP